MELKQLWQMEKLAVIRNINKVHMSRSVRKPLIWTLRNVSTQNSLRNPRRLIRADKFLLR